MEIIWDKNGVCNNCGYIPFTITHYCPQCNTIQEILELNTIYNNKIINLENGLHTHGVNYLCIENINIPNIDIIMQKYLQLDKLLRVYKHLDFTNCPWNYVKIYDPREQLITRIEKFLLDTRENINEDVKL